MRFYPPGLRRFVLSFLTHCPSLEPILDAFSDELLGDVRIVAERTRKRLIEILYNDYVERCGGTSETWESLSGLPLPDSITEQTFLQRQSAEVRRHQMQFPIRAQANLAEDSLRTFDVHQEAAYHSIVASALRPPTPSPTSDAAATPFTNIFSLMTPAGYGKTTVLRAATAQVRSRNKIVLNVATTGIAASLYPPEGQTAHTMFKIEISQNHVRYRLADGEYSSSLGPNTARAHLIRQAVLLTWDEVAMTDRGVIECVDRLLRSLRGNPHVPFGGITTVFGGDLRQLPPVATTHYGRSASSSVVIDRSIVSSPLWRHTQQLQLHRNYRAIHDVEYCAETLRVGNALSPLTATEAPPLSTSTRPHEEAAYFRLLPSLTAQVAVHTDTTAALEWAFPGGQYFHPDAAGAAIICCRNAVVNKINDEVIEIIRGLPSAPALNVLASNDMMPVVGDNVTSAAATIQRRTAGVMTPLALRNLNSPGIPRGHLTLCPGMSCVILRNMPAIGLMNGSRVFIHSIFAANFMVVVVKAADYKKASGILAHVPLSEQISLPRILFDFNCQKFGGCAVRRRQFPLAPAYAITVHKSQGQTLQRIVLNLTDPFFEHGHTYVALSRAVSRRGICLLTENPPPPDPGLIVAGSPNASPPFPNLWSVFYRPLLDIAMGEAATLPAGEAAQLPAGDPYLGDVPGSDSDPEGAENDDPLGDAHPDRRVPQSALICPLIGAAFDRAAPTAAFTDQFNELNRLGLIDGLATVDTAWQQLRDSATLHNWAGLARRGPTWPRGYVDGPVQENILADAQTAGWVIDSMLQIH
jgi:ATP-dependent DNA helicase PIF1